MIKNYSRRELKGLFYDNLNDLIPQKEIKGHVAEVLTGFAYRRSIPVLNMGIDTSLITKLFEKGKYAQLVQIGDAHLFICGWFYE